MLFSFIYTIKMVIYNDYSYKKEQVMPRKSFVLALIMLFYFERKEYVEIDKLVILS